MRRRRIRFVFFLAATILTLIAALRAFPPASEPPFDASLFTPPQVDKLLAIILSLGALTLLNLAALPLGRSLRDALHRPQEALCPRTAFVVDLGLGFLLLGDLLLLLAALDLLSKTSAVVVVLAAAILGAPSTYRALRSLSPPKFDFVGRLALVGFGLWTATGVLAAFVPDFGWDAFVYHLAVPERYLFEGGLWTTAFSFYSAFPHAAQILYVPFLAQGALIFDGAAAAQLLHFEFGLLTMLILALAARRFSRRASLLVLAVLVADPLWTWVSGTAYADLTACFYAALAVERTSRRDFVLGGAFLGGAFTVHYRLALLAVALAVVVFARRRKIRDLVVLTSFALLVASPWLIRNLFAFGNPVAPAAQSLFHAPGEEAFHPIAVEQSVRLAQRRGPGTSLEEFILLPWRLFASVRSDGSPLYMFQVGWIFLFAVIAWMLYRSKKDDETDLFAWTAAATIVLWFWSGAQESRYLLPALALYAVPGAVACDRLMRESRARRFAVAALLVVAVGATQWKSVRFLSWNWGYAVGALSTKAFARQEPALVVGETLRKTLREDDRLLLLFEGRAWFFRGLDYVPYHVNEGAPTLQRIHEAASIDDLEHKLRELGITHILINYRSLQKYKTMTTDEYTRQDFQSDLSRIARFLETRTSPYLEDRGVVVRSL